MKDWNPLVDGGSPEVDFSQFQEGFTFDSKHVVLHETDIK